MTRTLNRVDVGVPIDGTLPLAQELATSDAPLPITAAFVSYAAVLSVLLSAIGLYGALAFAVSRRTKEIGIRLAIGAEARTVLRMVLREGTAVIFAGVVIGVPLAIAATRFFRHLLYGAPSGDVPVYAAAVAIMMCAGLLASWTPARRAASVEPVVALREE